jgi:hypothetical protein
MSNSTDPYALRDQTYIEDYKCPNLFCKAESDDHQFGKLYLGEYDASQAFRRVTCNRCGTSWDETFDMVGISDVQNGQGETLPPEAKDE